MLQVFFEAGSYAGAETLWRQRYPDRFPLKVLFNLMTIKKDSFDVELEMNGQQISLPLQPLIQKVP